MNKEAGGEENGYEMMVVSTEPLLLQVTLIKPITVYFSFEESGGYGIGEINTGGPAFAFINESSEPAKVHVTYETEAGISPTNEVEVPATTIEGQSPAYAFLLDQFQGKPVREAKFELFPGIYPDFIHSVATLKVRPPRNKLK